MLCIWLRVKLLFEASGAESSVSPVIISPSMCRRKLSNAVWPFSSNTNKHPAMPWPIYWTTPFNTWVHASWQFKSLHLCILLLLNITAFIPALTLSSTTRKSHDIHHAMDTKYIGSTGFKDLKQKTFISKNSAEESMPCPLASVIQL